MDLAGGVGRVIVVADHINKQGDVKVLPECNLPRTGKGVVDRIVANLGVLDIVGGGLPAVIQLHETIGDSVLIPKKLNRNA